MRRDAEIPVLAERTQSGQGANPRQDKLIEDAEPGKTKAGYKDCTTHLTATAGNKKVGQAAETPPAVLEGNQSPRPKFTGVQAGMICKSGRISGVDGQHAAGNIAAAVSQQIFHHAGDIVRLGKPAQ